MQENIYIHRNVLSKSYTSFCHLLAYCLTDEFLFKSAICIRGWWVCIKQFFVYNWVGSILWDWQKGLKKIMKTGNYQLHRWWDIGTWLCEGKMEGHMLGFFPVATTNMRIAYRLGQPTYSLDRSVFIWDIKYLGEGLLQLLLTSHMNYYYYYF